MSISRILLFWRPRPEDGRVRDELAEAERIVVEQQRRLARIRHIQRERDLYGHDRRRPT